MVDQDLLQDAWAKARTLKAVDDLAARDPERRLLTDMLESVYKVSPHSVQLDSESHRSKAEIFDALTGADDRAFYRANAQTLHARRFLLDKLTEATLEFGRAGGSRLYPTRADLVVEMQRRIQHADPEFLGWLGNPVKGDLPAPHWSFAA